MNKSVIIVAAGKGMRMMSSLPKQFLLIHNKPILYYTIKAFLNFDKNIEIILVLAKDSIDYWLNISKNLIPPSDYKIVEGGSERYFSVKNGINALNNNTQLVAIHDGVRPIISTQFIEQCFNSASEYGNAIPCISPVESVRIINANDNEIIDRQSVRLIQTPQIFEKLLLTNAYNQPFCSTFTDDASVVEKLGVRIKLIDGERNNIKITTPFDFQIAEILLKTN